MDVWVKPSIVLLVKVWFIIQLIETIIRCVVQSSRLLNVYSIFAVVVEGGRLSIIAHV